MSTDRFDLKAQEVSPFDRAATKLLYISNAKYSGDWHSTMHIHNCTEIFYVVGGSGEFKIEELVCPVTANDMVIVNPGVNHTELGLRDYPLEYIVIGIEGLEFTVNDDESDDRYCIVKFQNGSEDILYYLRSMFVEIEHKPFGYISVCQDLLELLLIRLMRRHDFSLTPAKPGVRVSRECAAVRRYIDRHFKENISLEMLAELAHLNKYYFGHSFSQQYGVSPINYLISKRIEESKYLLANTDNSLSFISHILGFSSPSYFSQSFRKLAGMSPIEYRKKSGNTDKFSKPREMLNKK
ncbi:MAG: AraC family transcriptional regulator [Clostridiales bacterium]|nr:AraC family transcriptional regulator [Clostridiales bacterium]